MENKENRVRFMFLRNESKQPVGCLAITVNEVTNQVSFGMSVLNPKDEFDRAMAREIAEGRLKKSPHMVAATAVKSMHDVSFAVMKELKNDKYPSTARKAAEGWLKMTSKLKEDKASASEQKPAKVA